MSNKVSKEDLAKRYAKALFMEAQEQKCLNNVRDEINEIVKLAEESKEFKNVFESPVMDKKVRNDALVLVAEKMGVSKIVTNLLCLLCENERTEICFDIAKSFEKMVDEANGVLDVLVETAIAMEKDDREHLVKVLDGIYHKEIRLSEKVNPDLIGGISVQVGSVLVDVSIKKQLENIALAMKGKKA
ncbi:MAG: ATP synthase F1 subunit delta [Alphaproteobacteria bacterium]|nr:ATP synthase F1 subunit delta [Alphaproteobacteria bacterium]